jgi:hypothetical protein
MDLIFTRARIEPVASLEFERMQVTDLVFVRRQFKDQSP